MNFHFGRNRRISQVVFVLYFSEKKRTFRFVKEVFDIDLTPFENGKTLDKTKSFFWHQPNVIWTLWIPAGRWNKSLLVSLEREFHKSSIRKIFKSRWAAFFKYFETILVRARFASSCSCDESLSIPGHYFFLKKAATTTKLIYGESRVGELIK